VDGTGHDGLDAVVAGLAGVVSHTRDTRLADRLLAQVCRCAQAVRPLLVSTDEWAAYPASIQRAFREKLGASKTCSFSSWLLLRGLSQNGEGVHAWAHPLLANRSRCVQLIGGSCFACKRGPYVPSPVNGAVPLFREN